MFKYKLSPALAVAATLAALVALTASAQASSSTSSRTSVGATSASAKHYVVGSMIYDTTIPFLATMAHAEQQEAAKLGITLHLVSGNTTGTSTISQQVSEIEQFISEKVNLILVTPSESAAIVPAIKLANKAGIPVISVNTAVGSGAKTVTYVGVSYYQYGLSEGELAAKAINGHGNVALLLGTLGNQTEVQRTNGIKKALSTYPKIHIVTSVVDNWDNSQDITDVQNLDAKYNGSSSLSAIIAEGPQIYAGANYARSQGVTGTKFIGGDYPTQVRKAIISGSVYGTVDQDPGLEGLTGVQYALDWLDGHRSSVVRPEKYVPLYPVTKANVNEYQAKWSS